MKIAIIYLGRRGSGGPISLELAKGLAEHATVFSVLSQNNPKTADWAAAGLDYFAVATYTNLPEAVLSWLRSNKFRRIADKVRERQPDVLLFPMFYTWNPFIQHFLAGIPSVVAVHDPDPHPGIESSVFRRLEDVSIKKAIRCLVFSQGLIPVLAKRGVPLERIDAAPHGDLSYYRRVSATQIVRSASEKVILFFGRITEYKGLDVLLKAYRRLASVPGLRLIIAGEGSLRPYRSLLDGLPNVEIANRWIADEEVGGYFSRADMVILPYTSASQSGVIPLAAVYSLPVIATRTGGIPEQICDLQTGLLVDPGSDEQIAAAVMRLLDDPALAASLGERLYAHYQEANNWQRIAALVYESCRRAGEAGG